MPMASRLRQGIFTLHTGRVYCARIYRVEQVNAGSLTCAAAGAVGGKGVQRARQGRQLEQSVDVKWKTCQLIIT